MEINNNKNNWIIYDGFKSNQFKFIWHGNTT